MATVVGVTSIRVVDITRRRRRRSRFQFCLDLIRSTCWLQPVKFRYKRGRSPDLYSFTKNIYTQTNTHTTYIPTTEMPFASASSAFRPYVCSSKQNGLQCELSPQQLQQLLLEECKLTRMAYVLQRKQEQLQVVELELRAKEANLLLFLEAVKRSNNRRV